jgi:4-amino-4-deoxy-L-arabinose transferase-like glycosyltransferase
LTPRRVLLIGLLAAAVVPYFVGLGDSSIWDANEAFYVETPREMIERGDYVAPTFNYEPRLNKPVLSYWIVAGFYHVFGVSVAVQRIPIALGALVIIAVAFFLARAAVPENERQTLGVEAALWAAAGLAVTPRLLMFARRIFIDIYITLFLTLTLLFFALAERYPHRRRLFLVLMYVAVGLGTLTKGPIAVVLPGLVFFLYLLVHRELARVRRMMLPAGGAIVLAIVLPWCLALAARNGWGDIVAFILGENVARYTEGYGVDSERGPLFYLPVLFSDSFPLSLFLFAAWGAWRAARRTAHEPSDVRIATVCWLWIASFVGVFSLSAAKQDLYIFPIVPAVAALAGLTIARGLHEMSRLTRHVRITTIVIGVSTLTIGAGVVYFFRSAETPYAVRGAALMGLTGVVGGLTIVLAALASGARAAALATLIAFIAIDWVFVLRVLPAFERYKPVPVFARALEARLGPDDTVATYDEALPSLVYYLRRRVNALFDVEPLIALFRSGKGVYVVLSAENYSDLQPRLGVPTCVLERRPTFDVKLRNVLAQDALPELLLISNRCR